MIEFIKGFIEKSFLAANTPIQLACDGKRGMHVDQQLAKRVQALTKGTSLKDALAAARPEEVGRSTSAETFLRETLGSLGPALRHPEFPCFGLFDLKALKVEFHGLGANDEGLGPLWGLYAVVRESRGWAAKKADRVNLLVRDILWLSPRKQQKGEKLRGFWTRAHRGVSGGAGMSADFSG